MRMPVHVKYPYLRAVGCLVSSQTMQHHTIGIEKEIVQKPAAHVSTLDWCAPIPITATARCVVLGALLDHGSSNAAEKHSSKKETC